MQYIAKVPGFRVVGQSNGIERRQAVGAVCITLAFAFFPQLLGLLFFALGSTKEHQLTLFLYGQWFEHAEILIVTVSLIGPVFIAVMREGPLPERVWLGGYMVLITVFSAVITDRILSNETFTVWSYVLVSSLLFIGTVMLLWLSGILARIDLAATVGLEIEATARDQVQALKKQMESQE